MKKKADRNREEAILRKIVILLFWIGIWQLLTVIAGNPILMVGPLETGQAFIKNMVKADFLPIVFLSLGRLGIGFVCAFAAGLLLGMVCYRYRLMEELVQPVILLLKAVPVASFVVLLLIWWGADNLSVTVSFLIVFPGIYISTVNGLRSTDKKLLQMAQVFHMPLRSRLLYIYRPALRPFIDSCLKVSLGMSWKSGVAAELIGTPAFSIGERLYMSKIHLDTAGLFAWTAAIIILSFLFEKAGLFLWKSFCRWQPLPHSNPVRTQNPNQEAEQPEAIRRKAAEPGTACYEAENRAVGTRHILAQNLWKGYQGRAVLENVNHMVPSGSICCLMAPSGEGKTTLLRILAGLEKADRGQGEAGSRISMVFQEDRLCEEYSPIINIAMTGTDRETAAEALGILLPEQALALPCEQLSGGMKRRVALARAVSADSDILLLDEPFGGLDEETKQRCIQFVRDNRRGRTILLATHNEQDAADMGGYIWRLE